MFPAVHIPPVRDSVSATFWSNVITGVLGALGSIASSNVEITVNDTHDGTNDDGTNDEGTNNDGTNNNGTKNDGKTCLTQTIQTYLDYTSNFII